MDKGYVGMCALSAYDLRIRQLPCQYAYGQTRFRADLPTEYDPVAGITLPPERPRCWYRTTTYIGNDRANMHTIHRPTDSANMPAITTRPNDRADVPAIYRPIDRRALRSTTITT
jgi:hypothetical protein